MLHSVVTVHRETTAMARLNDGPRSPEEIMTTKLLTLRDVMRMTALSRSAVYALMGPSRFPKPIRISSRAVRWVEQEVLDFVASRPRGGTERPAP